MTTVNYDWSHNLKPPPAGLRERKKSQTRAALLDAALGLFSRQGIDATTIDQIAAAAGIGKGTFYNYFAAKEDIIVAFMASLEEKSLPAARRCAELEAPLEDILERFAWQLLVQKRQHRLFLRILLARMITPGETFLPYVTQMQAAIDLTLDTLFLRLIERGLVSSSIPLPHLRLTFKTMHLGLTMLWALEPPPSKETRKVLRTQMSMFSKGVAP